MMSQCKLGYIHTIKLHRACEYCAGDKWVLCEMQEAVTTKHFDISPAMVCVFNRKTHKARLIRKSGPAAFTNIERQNLGFLHWPAKKGERVLLSLASPVSKDSIAEAKATLNGI